MTLKQLIFRAKSYIPQSVKRALLAVRFAPRLLLNERRVLPNYIVFGSMRSGTSSLYHNLIEHPNVLAAFRKQTRFFDVNYYRGLGWYRGYFPTTARLDRVDSTMDGPVITGEASPEYIFHPKAAERIAQIVPDVRLIALLRNPIDRAYSHYHHTLKTASEPLSFKEAIDREPERIDGEQQRMAEDVRYDSRCQRYHDYAYLDQGKYAQHLERWFETFPREQMKITFSEDFFENPAETMADFCDFLRIPRWRPENYSAYGSRRYDEMGAELRTRLAEYFKPHNEALEQLLGRSVPWND